MGLVVFWLECIFLPLFTELAEWIGGVALAPRGLESWEARILLKCFFAGLGREVLTPSRLKPYSPYPLRAQGERNWDSVATSALWLFAGAYRGREIFGFQRLRRCGYLPGHTGGEKYSEFSDCLLLLYLSFSIFENMKKSRQNNRVEQKEARRELRTFGTMYEASFWKLLSNRQVEGVRFRRQFSVGPYILDFYAPELKLAIELDGYYHQTEDGLRHDYYRDAFLKSSGITLLRFENEYVFRSQSIVLDVLREEIKRLRQEKIF